ncbi:MAG TPA: class I SAM-dependent methyltransferase [Tepidisphaeraceae bacterium]|jgi:ubiquinone/menaquinone biosynthesis C-methylase UbiE
MPRNASERYHNRVAKQYDAIYDDAYWAFHDELTWRSIKPHLPRDATAACADLGCGTGKWGLKLLKSGFATTFVDHAPVMIEQTREKLAGMGPRASKATLVVGDIVHMPDLPSDAFALVTAMGDPLSICSDPVRAAREFARVLKPGGIVIATADNKFAAIDYYIDRGNLDALEAFVRAGKTHWLTPDVREQFELTTFTPAALRRLFENAGLEVLDVLGKSVLPVRQNRKLLEQPSAVERLLKLERELSKDPAACARAGHLQITARKPIAGLNAAPHAAPDAALEADAG